MARKRSRLICSAGSREQLERMINNYFHSENCTITDDLKVYNKKLSKILDYKVAVKAGRWRFELAE